MRVLWLVPEYYSFILDELQALSPSVEKLVVLSQARPHRIRGVETLQISPVRKTMRTAMKMARRAIASAGHLPVPRSKDELRAAMSVIRNSAHIHDVVQEHAIDVVHSHFAWPRGTAGALASDRPVVVSLRGVDIMKRPDLSYGLRLDGYFERTLRRTLTRVEAITVPSTTIRSALRDFVGNLQNTHLLRNGVDSSLYAPAADTAQTRDSSTYPDGSLLLGIGNLVRIKSFETLVEATAILRRAGYEVEVLILGEGPAREELEERIRRAGLAEAVQMPGRVERSQVRECLSACTVFVHPSHSEGFGNVVAEAMAAGRPVVATRTGVAADLINSGINGVLCPTADPAAMAEAITLFLTDPVRAAECGRRARETIRSEELTVGARAAGFVSIYGQVMGRCSE